VSIFLLPGSYCSPSLKFFQYLIANLGLSRNFGKIDLAHLVFPVHMTVDYIRVYQPKDLINIGCNPKDYPTEKYINQ